MALQPRQYRRIQATGEKVRDQLKAKKPKTEKMPLECGFIAQELQAVMPDAVVSFDDELLGIQSGQLIPVLVRAIQEISERITGLEKSLVSKK